MPITLFTTWIPSLALPKAIRYRDCGFKRPLCIVLISPWLDINLMNPGVATMATKDAMLDVDALRWCGMCWAGDTETKHALLSPIKAKLHDLPPIDIYQGTHDLLLANTRKLADLVSSAHGHIRVFESAGTFHVFPAATFTPEAKDVFRRIRNSRA